MDRVQFTSFQLIFKRIIQINMSIKLTLQHEITQFFTEIKDKLIHTVAQLESDQTLKLMQNDTNLYNHKMQHVQEIISEEFKLQEQLAIKITENQQLRKKLQSVELNLKNMSSQYASQLEKIDIECKNYITSKESQKREMEKEHIYEVQKYQEEVRRLNEHLKVVINQKQQTEISQATQKEVQSKFKQEKNQIIKQNEAQIRILENNLEQQRINHEQQYEKMQRDMHLIKEAWQKQCRQIENKMKEQNAMVYIEYEEKLKRELDKYVQAMKLGKNVVIKDSQHLTSKKIEIFQMNHQQEIQKMKEEIQQKDQIIKQYDFNLSTKIQELQKIETVLDSESRQFQRFEKLREEQKQHDQQQLGRMKSKISKLSDEISLITEEKYELSKISQNFKQEIEIFKKKFEHSNKINLQMQQQCNTLKNKISQNHSLIEKLEQRVHNQKTLVIQKQQKNKIFQLDLINKTKQQDQMEEMLEKKIEMQIQLKKVIKQMKEKETRIMRKLDKITIVVKKIEKQKYLICDHIRYLSQLQKTKIMTEVNKLNQYMIVNKDNIEAKYKLKMNQLIDQMEIASDNDKKQFDELFKEKENLISHLNDYENEIQKKDQEISKIKQLLLGKSRQTNYVDEEIKHLRNQTVKLEQKIIRNETEYHQNLSKAQKQVFRNTMSFTEKWKQQLKRLSYQIDKRNKIINQLNEKFELILNECQLQRNDNHNSSEHIKKLKKKYENLKEERDQKVKSLAHKLEQESRWRMNLQSELKQVRVSVMRNMPTSTSYNNFSFNNDLTGDKKNENHKGMNHKYNQREKELTELKDMIAKTQKVFESQSPPNYKPEKDISKQNYKRALF